MGCGSSQPVGEANTLTVRVAPRDSRNDDDDAAPPQSGMVRGALAAETRPASKSGHEPTQRNSPPDSDPSLHSARRLQLNPSHSRHDAPKNAGTGSAAAAERESSTSRVTRVADDEPEVGAASVPEKIATPRVHAPRHSRSNSVSLPGTDRPSRRRLGGGDDSPVRATSPLNPSQSPPHLGLSAGARGYNGKRAEVPLAQQILQRQANAAHGVENHTHSAAGSRPGSGHAQSGGGGSPLRSRHDRAHSLSVDLCPLTLPSAHNVPSSLFERASTPSSTHRDLPSSPGAGAGASPSPRAFGQAAASRDKWAARTEDLWAHYAGGGATHMPKKALMQLSEDLFTEFLAKYRSKLSADFAAAHSATTKKIYTDEQREKDLRKDLPFLLPAKPASGSGNKPEVDDYVNYIYRFAVWEMRRSGSAAPGASAAANGLGSIRSGSGVDQSPSMRSKRAVGNNSPRGGSMFNLDSPVGPAHSSGSPGLSSERSGSTLLTRAEFTRGWGHCHDLLFKCMDAEKERPGTPCKLM